MAPNTTSTERLNESKSLEKIGHYGSSGQRSGVGDPKKTAQPVPLLCSYRLLIVLMGSVVLCSSFASQTSMTSALVCMIDDEDHYSNSSSNSRSHHHPHHRHHDQQRSYHYNNHNDDQNNDDTTIGRNTSSPSSSSSAVNNDRTRLLSSNRTIEKKEAWKFSWSSETQGWVVSSFFVGYYVTQIPSGVIVTRIGPKSSLVIALLATGILHILSIPAARWSLTMLYVVRTLAGMACGCMLPGTFALVANWCPSQETSMLFAITSNGIDMGSSISFILALFGCETDFQGGWSIVFYALGLFHIVIGLSMLFCVTDFPSTHPYISTDEQRYIADNRAHDKKASVIPLGQILRSRAVWAFVVAQFATDWVIATVVTQGPLYLRDILYLPHWKTNMLSAFPFLFAMPFGLAIGYISKRLVETQTASTTTVRKLTETTAKILCSVPLVVLVTLPEGNWIGVFVLYTFVAIGIASTYSGFMANPADLSPAHAGFITSLGQALSMWAAFVIPVFTAYITQDKSRSSWQIIFYVTVAIEVFSMVFYLFFGSGALQPWALSPEVVGEHTPFISSGSKSSNNSSKNALTLSTDVIRHNGSSSISNAHTK